jgi:hypothetical protein
VNYSAYEQLVFIFGKIRLLAIEQHGGNQTFQLSHILRETHTFDIFLTLTHINTIFSRKSEKIGNDPTFVLTLLFASKYSYLAESIAIK